MRHAWETMQTDCLDSVSNVTQLFFLFALLHIYPAFLRIPCITQFGLLQMIYTQCLHTGCLIGTLPVGTVFPLPIVFQFNQRQHVAVGCN